MEVVVADYYKLVKNIVCACLQVHIYIPLMAVGCRRMPIRMRVIRVIMGSRSGWRVMRVIHIR